MTIQNVLNNRDFRYLHHTVGQTKPYPCKDICTNNKVEFVHVTNRFILQTLPTRNFTYHIYEETFTS